LDWVEHALVEVDRDYVAVDDSAARAQLAEAFVRVAED
jgi:hypothetical protein